MPLSIERPRPTGRVPWEFEVEVLYQFPILDKQVFKQNAQTGGKLYLYVENELKADHVIPLSEANSTGEFFWVPTVYHPHNVASATARVVYVSDGVAIGDCDFNTTCKEATVTGFEINEDAG